MSKVGKLPVELPEGVTVTVDSGDFIVKGPKGELKRTLPRTIEIEVKDNEAVVKPKNNTKETRALFGTTRAHLANMVTGVTEGWSKKLELVGTGYRAELRGNTLVLNVGFSHPIEFEAPEGISFKVEKSIVTIDGIDKEAVGLISANIRKVRPPEPYKGKGIRYEGEYVRRKAGKAAKAAA